MTAWIRPGRAACVRRAVVLAAAGLLLATLPAQAGKICGVGSPAMGESAKLRWLPEVVEQGAPVTIVVLGTGSSLGAGASGADASYPARLEAALAGRLHRSVHVVNRAVRHQTTAEMGGRIVRDVVPEHPALVIWEIGTVDAVRGIEPEDFVADLRKGLGLLQRAGIDVLLVEPQFAKATAGMLNMLPFVDAVRSVATAEQILEFRRYDITRRWLESGFLSFEQADRAALTAEIDKAYDCIGQLLAWQIDRAATRWPGDAPRSGTFPASAGRGGLPQTSNITADNNPAPRQ